MKSRRLKAWARARKKKRARRRAVPGTARAAVLFICAVALLLAKLALGAESQPRDDAKADSLLGAGRAQADEKRFEDAAATLRRALDARPGDSTITSLLARVLSWNHRYDESIALYRVLLAAHPGDAFDRAGYARVLAWSGRHEESVREFRRAVAADSTDLEARVGLARALSWSGDLPGAAMEFRRILDANPSYGDAWVGYATVVRWRGAPAAADRFVERGGALGADPAGLDEEREAVRRALAPGLGGGWTTLHEHQRASGAPDFSIEETGPFVSAQATLGRAVGFDVRASRTRYFEKNTRSAPNDTTLDFDLTSRSLRAGASFLRGYPVQASVGGEWRSFDAEGTKVLYPLTGSDTFSGWNARVWGYAGRLTPGAAVRRTFLALKGFDAGTGTLRFEPGNLREAEGSLGWQWSGRGDASLLGVRGESSDGNRSRRSGAAVGYRVRAGRPGVRLDYAAAFSDWDFASPSYFTPLASTRHAAGITLTGYSERNALDYSLRWEISHLASSNFADIVTNSFDATWSATLADRFPVGAEASWSDDNNRYETWAVSIFTAWRW